MLVTPGMLVKGWDGYFRYPCTLQKSVVVEGEYELGWWLLGREAPALFLVVCGAALLFFIFVAR